MTIIEKYYEEYKQARKNGKERPTEEIIRFINHKHKLRPPELAQLRNLINNGEKQKK